MAVVISNNVVLGKATTQDQGKAGVIAYKSVLNTGNVTASSELPTNPITNVANPATAYTWESAVADIQGSISYPGATNLMPSPFDPSGWTGVGDPDVAYQSITEDNPSGQSFVGEFTCINETFCQVNQANYVTPSPNGKYYTSILVKGVSGENLGLRIITRSVAGQIDNSYVSLATLTGQSSLGGSFNNIPLSDDYSLVQLELDVQLGESELRSEVYMWKVDGVAVPLGFPSTGDSIRCQAVFFGRNPLEYPYTLRNEFQDPNEVSEWTPVNCTISAVNGLLNGVATGGGTDPFFFQQLAQNFDGSKYYTVEVKYRINSGFSGGQFWWRDSTGAFDSNKQVVFGDNLLPFEVTTGPDVDGFFSTTLDMSQFSEWSSGSDTDISQLRFDFSNSATGDFDVDYIRIYDPSALVEYDTWWPAEVDEGGIKIVVDTAAQSIDYIGIARHNLNQSGLTVDVKYDGITVVPPTAISDIQALLFLQNKAVPDQVVLTIKGATVPPQIGVIRIGESLRLERDIYVGHTPINYGRNRTAFNGVSENGQYLGEVVVRQNNTTSVNLQNLTPNWYRTMLDPFFAQVPRQPCFWAWRPDAYPDEVGYAWVEGEPRVSNQRANGMMSANWNFKAIA